MSTVAVGPARAGAAAASSGSGDAHAASAVTTTVRWRMTGAGWALLLVSVAIAGAAVNTANNLLYLLLALLLAAYPASFVLAKRCLRAVSAELLLPERLTAGEVGDAVAVLEGTSARHGGGGFLVEAPGQPDARRAVPFVMPGSRVPVSLPLSAQRRGPLALSLLVRCAFPFGLLETYREAATGQLLVLPRPLPSGRRPVRMGETDGERGSNTRGAGVELLSIREYVDGDDARAVEWKATARLGRRMVRENAAEHGRRVTLLVDTTLPEGERHRAEEAVEEIISRAAGAALALHGEGWLVRVMGPGTSAEGEPGSLLACLARLEYREGVEGSWSPRLPQGESLVRFRAAGGEA